MCQSPLVSLMVWDLYLTTVKPPSKGRSYFVLCKEVVIFSEVKNVWEGSPKERPLLGGGPFLGWSFIGGYTVPLMKSNDP